MKDFLKRNSTIILLLFVLSGSTISMWFSETTSLGSPKDLGLAIGSFFQNSTNAIGGLYNDTVNSAQTLETLRKDYNQVVARLRTLEEQQSDIDSLRQQNFRLGEILNLKGGLSFSTLVAQVIGKDPGIIFSTITVNKGYNDGVRKDMPVIVIQDGKQSLVGKISTVAPFSSRIQPLYDRRSNIGGRLSTSRFEGLLIGNGSGEQNLTMTYIDPAARNQLKIGDEVSTSGLNSIFPAGIPIGTVEAIEKKPYESFLELSIKPLCIFGKLDYIYVLIGGLQ